MSEVYTVEESLGIVEIYDGDGSILEILQTAVEIIEVVTPELVGPQGPPGIQGLSGPQGIQGDPGPPGPFAPTFRQEFATPSDTWLIVHNLDVFPVVDIYDFNGYEIGGDVQMPDRNTVVVLFDVPMAGIAILKA